MTGEAWSGLILAAAPPNVGQALDLVSAGLLAFGAIRGGLRGLTGELARVAGFAAALAVGYGISKHWSACALRWFPDATQGTLRTAVVAVGLVVAATLAGHGIRWLTERFLRLLLDQPADAVLGTLAGGFRAILWIVALFFLASFVAFGNVGRILFADSVAGRMAFPAVQRLRAHIGPLDPSLLVRGALRSPNPAPDPERSGEAQPL